MLKHIGRYEILERIAVGGQGTVYRARDTVLDRTVAVKLINEPIAADQPYLEALQREARLAARLEHSNITSVYDFQVEDGQPFIVMEYVPDSLDKHMSGGKKLPDRKAMEIAIQVCRALSHAHKAGVIHRDIKPQNILLTQDGSAKVSDFGIARALASSTATRATDVLGTPPYMAVEQWSGARVDSRTDIYSLAVLLYEMLTGERPYRGETFGELYVQHREHPAPPVPRELGPIAVPVEKVLHRAMEKRPEDRFNNADEMAAALEEVLAGRPAETSTSAGPETKRRLPLVEKFVLTRKIAPALYGAAAVFALASIVGGLAAAGVFSNSNPPPLSAASNSVVITPPEAARLLSEDGIVIVDVEPQSVDKSATLSYRSVEPSEVPALPANFSATGTAFDLTLDSALVKPITVTVGLSDADITQAGGDYDNIVIQHYNGGAWNQLETSADIGASTAAALVDQLSIFAVAVRGPDPTPMSPPPNPATPLSTTSSLPGLTTSPAALPTVGPSAMTPDTATPIPTATPVPTPTPTTAPTPNLVPTPTPTAAPTPTPVPTPSPTTVPTPTPTPLPAYSLRINGNVVPAGQSSVPVLNGTVTLSDGPRADGHYSANQVVTLVANPTTARSQVFWGGVDNQNGSLATVRMGAERFVTVNIVLTPPTATPPPPPTPTPTPAVEQGPGHRTVSVLGDRLAFNTSYFTASEGEVVTMTFNNVSTINTHNWVLVEAGTTNDVASAGGLWPLNDWIPPDDPRVFANTRLLLPGETDQVVFTAPKAGIYQFVCTFAGHNLTMFGAFVVTAP